MWITFGRTINLLSVDHAAEYSVERRVKETGKAD